MSLSCHYLRCPIFTLVANFCRKVLYRENKRTDRSAEKNRIAVIPRDCHTISRTDISENALKVLYRLHRSGYQAYLVGGGVRDLLLGKQPKDFDITTNATPGQIRKLFRNCRLVGRRFRLAHIMFGSEVIEVATFRGHHHASHQQPNSNQSQQGHNGMLLRDNIFGTVEDDAQRRDLTINALYYSIADFSLRDYADGLHDLQQGIIRLIGDPETRYREDPVRMLRVIRFSAKLNMKIAEETATLVPRLAVLLHDVPSARLFEETLKLFQAGFGYQSYLLLRQYQVFQPLFPIISRYFTKQGDSAMERMIAEVLKNTDARIQNQMPVNPAFLFAAMFWYPLLETKQKIAQESGLPHYEAYVLAIDDLLNDVGSRVAIPKWITLVIRDIWQLQPRLTRRHNKRVWKQVEHPKFRAACKLLALRATVENAQELQRLVNFWSQLQVVTPAQQKTEVNTPAEAKRSRRRTHHLRNRKPNGQLHSDSNS